MQILGPLANTADRCWPSTASCPEELVMRPLMSSKLPLSAAPSVDSRHLAADPGRPWRVIIAVVQCCRPWSARTRCQRRAHRQPVDSLPTHRYLQRHSFRQTSFRRRTPNCQPMRMSPTSAHSSSTVTRLRCRILRITRRQARPSDSKTPPHIDSYSGDHVDLSSGLAYVHRRPLSPMSTTTQPPRSQNQQKPQLDVNNNWFSRNTCNFLNVATKKIESTDQPATPHSCYIPTNSIESDLPVTLSNNFCSTIHSPHHPHRHLDPQYDNYHHRFSASNCRGLIAVEPRRIRSLLELSLECAKCKIDPRISSLPHLSRTDPADSTATVSTLFPASKSADREQHHISCQTLHPIETERRHLNFGHYSDWMSATNNNDGPLGVDRQPLRVPPAATAAAHWTTTVLPTTPGAGPCLPSPTTHAVITTSPTGTMTDVTLATANTTPEPIARLGSSLFNSHRLSYTAAMLQQWPEYLAANRSARFASNAYDHRKHLRCHLKSLRTEHNLHSASFTGNAARFESSNSITCTGIHGNHHHDHSHAHLHTQHHLSNQHHFARHKVTSSYSSNSLVELNSSGGTSTSESSVSAFKFRFNFVNWKKRTTVTSNR